MGMTALMKGLCSNSATHLGVSAGSFPEHWLVIEPIKTSVFLFSSEVASHLSHALSIIDLACKDEKAFALSSLLQVPLIKVDAIEDDTLHKYAVSIRPSYRVICKALFDVMSFYSFKRVAIVYDGKSFTEKILLSPVLFTYLVAR